MKPAGSRTCLDMFSGDPCAPTSWAGSWPRISKFLYGFRPVQTWQPVSHVGRKVGMGRGRAWSRGQQLTRVVGDIGLIQVPARDEGGLRLAEVLNEPGLGHRGENGAWALLHAGVCEQLCCGAPIGVPHLVTQLWIEAGIAAEGRGAGPVGKRRSLGKALAIRMQILPATQQLPDLTCKMGVGEAVFWCSGAEIVRVHLPRGEIAVITATRLSSTLCPAILHPL